MKKFLKLHSRSTISLLLIFQMIFVFIMSSFGLDSSSAQSGQIIQALRQVFPNLNNTSNLDASTLVLIVRKTAHFTEYAILGILFFLFFRQFFPQKNGSRYFIPAILFSFFYACTDEIHQLFIPGRSGQFTDVLIDTLGALFGCLLLVLFRRSKKAWQARHRSQ